MTKLASIIFLPGGPGFCKKHGIGPQAERWLLEQYNCSLGNTGNSVASIAHDDDNISDAWLNSKHIIPIFGYPESWAKARDTYRGWLSWEFLAGENVYYYNCGDGAWLGLDEPGSRGDKAYRAFDWGRAYEHVKLTLNLMPSVKPVVTMPRTPRSEVAGGEHVEEECYEAAKCRPFSDFGTDIVYAYDTHVIAMAEAEFADNVPSKTLKQVGWRTVLDIPADAEVWAYNAIYPLGKGDTNLRDPYQPWFFKDWTPTPTDKPNEMGPWLRERGISAWLHNANIKYLTDSTATDPRQMLSENGEALLRSIADG